MRLLGFVCMLIVSLAMLSCGENAGSGGEAGTESEVDSESDSNSDVVGDSASDSDDGRGTDSADIIDSEQSIDTHTNSDEDTGEDTFNDTGDADTSTDSDSDSDSNLPIRVLESIDVAPVFAALSVDFDMFTTDTHQVVAYYDSSRRMTVAIRPIDSQEWVYATLPSTVGWDSHNYITVAVDSDGYIHVSGNMHNVSLIYFRSINPLSVDGFESPTMVGNLESSVTYPALFLNNEGELHFSYRTGGSGDGTTVWNKYNVQTRSWTRLTAEGLFNGNGEVNAYHNYVPIKGPDNRFHIVFMWRETPVANTNLHISHICSSDLTNWETYLGTPVQIPVTTQTAGVVVDGVESGNGLINMGFGIGWDTLERPIVTYHKYDSDGVSQYYNTRLEEGVWQIHQTSNWANYKWPLDLQGSLAANVQAQAVTIDPENRLVQTSYHVDHGEKTWILNPDTLAIEEERDDFPVAAIAELMQLQNTVFPQMVVHLKRYGDWYLRWETLPINQDQAYDPPYPEPSTLTLYRVGQ